jgi:putative addiction module component (TIGR02574 family)
MSYQKIKNAAMKLAPKRRARLAEMLLVSLGRKSELSIEAAWAEEVELRIADIESGKTKSKPLYKMLRRLRERHKVKSRD